MATNKTRLAFYDHTSATPSLLSMTMQFDVYQDAIDYVETFLNTVKPLYNPAYIVVLLFSYDNTSYSYSVAGGGSEFVKTEITFPDNF